MSAKPSGEHYSALHRRIPIANFIFPVLARNSCRQCKFSLNFSEKIRSAVSIKMYKNYTAWLSLTFPPYHPNWKRTRNLIGRKLNQKLNFLALRFSFLHSSEYLGSLNSLTQGGISKSLVHESKYYHFLSRQVL